MAFKLSSRHVYQPFLFHGVDVERRVGEDVVGAEVGMEVAADVALAPAGVAGEEGWCGRHVDGS